LLLKAFKAIGRPVAPPALPQRVQRFLLSHIDSIEKLEVLLLLRNRGDREWSAGAVAQELRITEAAGADRLADLTSRGMLVSKGGSPPAYSYGPVHPEDLQSITELAETYAERRVSVIQFIFSKSPERVRAVAKGARPRKGGDPKPG
jgi:hypothetical protein